MVLPQLAQSRTSCSKTSATRENSRIGSTEKTNLPPHPLPRERLSSDQIRSTLNTTRKLQLWKLGSNGGCHVLILVLLAPCSLLTGRCRLKELRKSWKALQTPLPQVPTLSPQDTDPNKVALPDSSLLDTDEARMLEALTDSSLSFASLKSTTRSRLQAIQSNVEFKVDNLADSVHKMDLRVTTASKQADKVLALSSERLKDREAREREAAGTKEMPVMEVLRSLGRILPENGG